MLLDGAALLSCYYCSASGWVVFSVCFVLPKVQDYARVGRVYYVVAGLP